MALDGYLTTKQVAEKWNVSERKVSDMCKNGKIEGAKKEGRQWFIPKGAIKFPGFSTASPLTVTTRSINGFPLITALWIPIKVSTLSTIHPASAGSFAE